MLASRNLRKGFTLIELMIVVAIIGILASIAIPNFIRFQAKSKQSEVKANLAAAFTAEKAYYADKDTYTNLVSLIGFNPERGNRYCYDLGGGGSGVFQTRQTTVTGVDSSPPQLIGIEADTFKFSGVTPTMTRAYTAQVVPLATGSFSANAAGNIDADATLDQWSVSSFNRSAGTSSTTTTSCAAGNNPAGEPCNDQNDVTQ